MRCAFIWCDVQHRHPTRRPNNPNTIKHHRIYLHSVVIKSIKCDTKSIKQNLLIFNNRWSVVRVANSVFTSRSIYFIFVLAQWIVSKNNGSARAQSVFECNSISCAVEWLYVTSIFTIETPNQPESQIHFHFKHLILLSIIYDYFSLGNGDRRDGLRHWWHWDWALFSIFIQFYDRFFFFLSLFCSIWFRFEIYDTSVNTVFSICLAIAVLDWMPSNVWYMKASWTMSNSVARKAEKH